MPPPVLQQNDWRSLGEPFDSRARLLESYARVRTALQAAQVDGNQEAVYTAGWAVTDALADLESHEHHLATTLVMMLRFAVKHHPATVSDLFSEVPTVAQIADAVAALEIREGVLA